MPPASLDELKEYLAMNIRDLRKQLKMTQEEAAEATGLNWRHWQKMEAGDVDKDAIVVPLRAGLKFFLADNFAVLLEGEFDWSNEDLFQNKGAEDEPDATNWQFNTGIVTYF